MYTLSPDPRLDGWLAKTGPITNWFDSTKAVLESRGFLVEGERDSLWTIWHANGVVKARGAYFRGDKIGVWDFFHPDGTAKKRATYLDSIEEGNAVLYGPDGDLVESGAYSHGIRVGPWTSLTGTGVEQIRFHDEQGRAYWVWMRDECGNSAEFAP